MAFKLTDLGDRVATSMNLPRSGIILIHAPPNWKEREITAIPRTHFVLRHFHSSEPSDTCMKLTPLDGNERRFILFCPECGLNLRLLGGIENAGDLILRLRDINYEELKQIESIPGLVA